MVTIREHITALETALSACLANPAEQPVHRLRTQTRRVGALLALLPTLPSLPHLDRHATKLQRILRKLRRAAGSVRDFDVQLHQLDHLAKHTESHLSQEASPEPSALLENVPKLRDHLSAQRVHTAEHLLALLRAYQPKAARATARLLATLQPAETATLASPELVRVAQTLAQRRLPAPQARLRRLTEHELHNVRKAAKAARYLAEILPNDPTAAEAARRFEALQDAGGQWHDALDLTRAARHHLGKHNPLTQIFHKDRDRHLASYLRALAESAKGQRKLPKYPPMKAHAVHSAAAAF